MIHNPDTAHLVHYAFEWLALAAGLFVYRAIRRRRSSPGLTQPGQFAVVIGCLLGAAIGNKLAFWLEQPQLWAAHATDLSAWFDGQSIVGGLLGGWLGVEAGKRVAGITQRTGDDFVVPILCGILVGRVGCFLAGLHDGTYGVPTQLPWGIDFGDGIARHPTQLYEWLLALVALLTWPRWHKQFSDTPGLAFRVLVLGYLLWRVAVDTIKPVPYAYALGLSGIQWICVLASGVIVLALTRDYRKTAYA